MLAPRQPPDTLVLVKGGGDLGTGVAHMLFRSGFPVIVTETERPTMVRRTICFAECLYAGRFTVDGVPADRAEGQTPEEKLDSARTLLGQRTGRSRCNSLEAPNEE